MTAPPPPQPPDAAPPEPVHNVVPRKEKLAYGVGAMTNQCGEQGYNAIAIPVYNIFFSVNPAYISMVMGMTRSPSFFVAATPNHIKRPPLRRACFERQSCLAPPMGSKTTSTPSPVSAWMRSTKSPVR